MYLLLTINQNRRLCCWGGGIYLFIHSIISSTVCSEVRERERVEINAIKHLHFVSFSLYFSIHTCGRTYGNNSQQVDTIYPESRRVRERERESKTILYTQYAVSLCAFSTDLYRSSCFYCYCNLLRCLSLFLLYSASCCCRCRFFALVSL